MNSNSSSKREAPRRRKATLPDLIDFEILGLDNKPEFLARAREILKNIYKRGRKAPFKEIVVMIAEVAAEQGIEIEEARWLTTEETDTTEREVVLSFVYKGVCHTKSFDIIEIEDFACFYPTTLRFRELFRKWLLSVERNNHTSATS